MTRLAILSDVHADIENLTQALAAIEVLGCEAIVCCGDLVDYGLFPEETIALLREHRIPCIRGNHDNWALGANRVGDATSRLDDGRAFFDASGWDLSSRALQFLADLPARRDETIDGVRIAIRHANLRSDIHGILPGDARAPDVTRWLEEARADVLIVGHTHLAFESRLPGGGMLVNPGALVRDDWAPDVDRRSFYHPEAGEITASHPAGGTFGVLELPERRFTVHRVLDGAEVEIPRLALGQGTRRYPSDPPR